MSENLTGSNMDSLLYCWTEHCSSYGTQKKIQASYVKKLYHVQVRDEKNYADHI